MDDYDIRSSGVPLSSHFHVEVVPLSNKEAEHSMPHRDPDTWAKHHTWGRDKPGVVASEVEAVDSHSSKGSGTDRSLQDLELGRGSHKVHREGGSLGRP